MVKAVRKIFLAYLHPSSAGYLWDIVSIGVAITKAGVIASAFFLPFLRFSLSSVMDCEII